MYGTGTKRKSKLPDRSHQHSQQVIACHMHTHYNITIVDVNSQYMYTTTIQEWNTESGIKVPVHTLLGFGSHGRASRLRCLEMHGSDEVALMKLTRV